MFLSIVIIHWDGECYFYDTLLRGLHLTGRFDSCGCYEVSVNGRNDWREVGHHGQLRLSSLLYTRQTRKLVTATCKSPAQPAKGSPLPPPIWRVNRSNAVAGKPLWCQSPLVTRLRFCPHPRHLLRVRFRSLASVASSCERPRRRQAKRSNAHAVNSSAFPR